MDKPKWGGCLQTKGQPPPILTSKLGGQEIITCLKIASDDTSELLEYNYIFKVSTSDEFNYIKRLFFEKASFFQFFETQYECLVFISTNFVIPPLTSFPNIPFIECSRPFLHPDLQVFVVGAPKVYYTRSARFAIFHFFKLFDPKILIHRNGPVFRLISSSSKNWTRLITFLSNVIFYNGSHLIITSNGGDIPIVTIDSLPPGIDLRQIIELSGHKEHVIYSEHFRDAKLQRYSLTFDTNEHAWDFSDKMNFARFGNYIFTAHHYIDYKEQVKMVGMGIVYPIEPDDTLQSIAAFFSQYMQVSHISPRWNVRIAFIYAYRPPEIRGFLRLFPGRFGIVFGKAYALCYDTYATKEDVYRDFPEAKALIVATLVNGQPEFAQQNLNLATIFFEDATIMYRIIAENRRIVSHNHIVRLYNGRAPLGTLISSVKFQLLKNSHNLYLRFEKSNVTQKEMLDVFGYYGLIIHIQVSGNLGMVGFEAENSRDMAKKMIPALRFSGAKVREANPEEKELLKKPRRYTQGKDSEIPFQDTKQDRMFLSDDDFLIDNPAGSDDNFFDDDDFGN